MNIHQARAEARHLFGSAGFALRGGVRCNIGFHLTTSDGKSFPIIVGQGLTFAKAVDAAKKNARKAVRTRRVRRYAVAALAVLTALTGLSWFLP